MLEWLHKSFGNAVHRFDAMPAIESHLAQRDRIEAYVNGDSKHKSDVFMRCNSDWKSGLCTHGVGEKHCSDTGLLDSICSSCNRFHDAVFEVILLADVGKSHIARTELQAGKRYSVASVEFQQRLSQLQLSNQTKLNHKQKALLSVPVSKSLA